MTSDGIFGGFGPYTPPWVRAEAERIIRGDLAPQAVLNAARLPALPPLRSFQVTDDFWRLNPLYLAFSALEPLHGGAWPTIKQLVFASSQPRVGELATACFLWFRRWLSTQNSGEVWVPMRTWARSSQWPRETYAQELSAEFQDITQRLAAIVEKRPHDGSLARAFLLFGWRGFMGREAALRPKLRKLLVLIAVGELRKFRLTLRDSSLQQLSGEHVEHLEAALRVVVSFQSLWAGMKELLQALRFCSRPCVTSALSFFPEDGADQGWSRVAFWLDALLFTFGFVEARTDADLVRTRTAYASYCADRLDQALRARRSKRQANGPLEPSPQWRTAFVHALVELQQPLEGRVAAVLDAAARSDPDDAVRMEASRAMKKLAGGRKSPIQGLYAANWWMRRAHLLELVGEYDAAAAREVWKRDRYRAKRLGSEFELPDPDLRDSAE